MNNRAKIYKSECEKSGQRIDQKYSYYFKHAIRPKGVPKSTK